MVGYVPVLIHEDNSVFSIQGVIESQRLVFDESEQPRWLRELRGALPSMDLNVASTKNFATLRRLLTEDGRSSAVLVLGGATLGDGVQELMGNRLEIVESDVYLAPRTGVVLDAHDIPFADSTFDAVVAQAVLEHVVDPYGSVSEIWRVLKPRGIVYAETPFMQQVHGGRYDFTRFTPLGHRRLFRRFEELDSGAVLGPGTSLAWSWTYFLSSFCRSARSRPIAHAIGRLTGFFWKYFDSFLAGRPAALDAASGLYFLGRKGPEGWSLSDPELLASYRGIHE
jgi:SAM-dependent methyltransferase